MQYVTTQIVEPVATVENWLGVQSPLAAINRAFQRRPAAHNALQHQPADGGRREQPTVQYVQFDHTWLQGTIAGPGGLPRSLLEILRLPARDSRHRAAVPFDAAAEANYLSQVRTELAYQWYEDQVSTLPCQQRSPARTIADVPYTGPIQQQVVQPLPARRRPSTYDGIISGRRNPSARPFRRSTNMPCKSA